MAPMPGINVGDGVSFSALDGKRAAGKVESILASSNGSKLYVLRNDGSRAWVDLASFKEVSENPLNATPAAHSSPPAAKKGSWPPPASQANSWAPVRSPAPKPSLIEDVLTYAASHDSASAASTAPTKKSSRLSDRLAQKAATQTQKLPSEESNNNNATNYDLPSDFPDRDATSLYHHLSNGGDRTPTRPNANAPKAVQATPSLAAALANPGHVKASAAKLLASSSWLTSAEDEERPRALFQDRELTSGRSALQWPPQSTTASLPAESAANNYENPSCQYGSSSLLARRASQLRQRDEGAHPTKALSSSGHASGSNSSNCSSSGNGGGDTKANSISNSSISSRSSHGTGSSATNPKSAKEMARGIVREASNNSEIRDTTPSLLAARKNNTVKLRLQTMRTAASNSPPPFALTGSQQRFSNPQRPVNGARKNALFPQPPASSSTSSNSISSKASSQSSQSTASPLGSTHSANPEPISPLTAVTTEPSSSKTVMAGVERTSRGAASPEFLSPVVHETSSSSSAADELPSPPARVSNRAPSPSFLSMSPAALALLQEPLPPYNPSAQPQPNAQPPTIATAINSAKEAPALTYSALVASYRAPASSSSTSTVRQRDAQPPPTSIKASAPVKRGGDAKPAEPRKPTFQWLGTQQQPQQQQQQQASKSQRPQPSKPLYKPSANLRAKARPWERDPNTNEESSDANSSTVEPVVAMGGAAVTGTKARRNVYRSPSKEEPPPEAPSEAQSGGARQGRLTPEPDKAEVHVSFVTAAMKFTQTAADLSHAAPENTTVLAKSTKDKEKSSPEATTAAASDPSAAPNTGIVKRLAGRFTPPAPSTSPARRASPASSSASPLLVHLKPSSPLIPSPPSLASHTSSSPPNATTSAPKPHGGWLSGRKSPKPPWSKAATSVTVAPGDASTSTTSSSSSSLPQQQPPWQSGKRALRSLLTERPNSNSPDSSSNSSPPPPSNAAPTTKVNGRTSPPLLIASGGPALVPAPWGTPMRARNVLRTPSPRLPDADANAPANGVADKRNNDSSSPPVEKNTQAASEKATSEEVLVPAMREDGFGGYTLLARRAGEPKDVPDANRWTDVASASSGTSTTVVTDREPTGTPPAVESAAPVATAPVDNVEVDAAADEEIAATEQEVEDEDEAEATASRSRRRRILSTTPPFDPPEAAGRLNSLEPLGLANGWPGVHHHATRSERSWIAGAGSPVREGELSPVNSGSFDGAVGGTIVEVGASSSAPTTVEPARMESPPKAKVAPSESVTVALTPVASSPLAERPDTASNAVLTPAPENPFKAPSSEPAAVGTDLLTFDDGSNLALENAPNSPPPSVAVDEALNSTNEVSAAMTATEAYNIAEAEAAARRAVATTPSATPGTITKRVLEANAARQLARSLDATEFGATCADFPPVTTLAATKAEFDDLLNFEEPTKTEAPSTHEGEKEGHGATVEADIDPFESLVSETQADEMNISELALGDVSMLSAETSQTDGYTLNLSLDDVAVGEVVKGADSSGGDRVESEKPEQNEEVEDDDDEEDEDDGEDVDSASDSSVEVSGLPTLDEEDEEEEDDDETPEEISVELGDERPLNAKLTPVAEETSASSSPRKPLRRDLTRDEVLEEAGVDTSTSSISPQTSTNDVLAKAAARLSPDTTSALLTSDAYFMAIAELSARQSTDKIQAGACIVNSDGHIVGLGSRTIPDDMPLDSADGNAAMDDLSLVVHAEVAALLHSSSANRPPPTGPSSHQRSSHKGHTLCLHGAVPCDSCARLIAQSGFKEVVMIGGDIAKDSTQSRLFARAGVSSRALPTNALTRSDHNKADGTTTAAAEARVASADHRAEAAEHRAAAAESRAEAAEHRASSLANEVETLRSELEDARAEAKAAASRDLQAREAAEAFALTKEEEAASALDAAATALEEAAEAAEAAEQEKEKSALLKQQMNELRAALSPQNSIRSSRFLSPGGPGELSFGVSPLNNPDLFSTNHNNNSDPGLDRSATIVPPFMPASESASAASTEFDFFNPGHGS